MIEYSQGLWNEPRGKNQFDSGSPYYNIYKTLDNKEISISEVTSENLSNLAMVKHLFIINF